MGLHDESPGAVTAPQITNGKLTVLSTHLSMERRHERVVGELDVGIFTSNGGFFSHQRETFGYVTRLLEHRDLAGHVGTLSGKCRSLALSGSDTGARRFAARGTVLRARWQCRATIGARGSGVLGCSQPLAALGTERVTRNDTAVALGALHYPRCRLAPDRCSVAGFGDGHATWRWGIDRLSAVLAETGSLVVLSATMSAGAHASYDSC
jgi:hypothetical protein